MTQLLSPGDPDSTGWSPRHKDQCPEVLGWVTRVAQTHTSRRPRRLGQTTLMTLTLEAGSLGQDRHYRRHLSHFSRRKVLTTNIPRLSYIDSSGFFYKSFNFGIISNLEPFQTLNSANVLMEPLIVPMEQNVFTLHLIKIDI